MSEEKKYIPKRRFKEFQNAGDWEQRKLGELVHFSKGTGYSKADLKGFGIPIILYGRLYTKYETVITEVDTFAEEKPVSIYSHGGEVIVPASGETAEDISIASVVEKSGVLLGGDLNIITPPDGIDSAFLAISISNGKPHDDMAKMAQGKSVVHLHNADLEKINLLYPDHTEQTKISGYFKQLDDLIIFHHRKLEKIKALKKAYLSEMFPAEGESKPKRRFAGFTDVWEQRKIGECFKQRNESMPDGELISVTINSGIKKFSELGRHNNSNEDKTKYKKVAIGDIAYNSMRMWQGASGYSPYDGIVSPAYTVITPKDGIDSKCISYLFKREDMINKFKNSSQGITSDNWNLKFPALSEINIMVASDITEQEKIGTFFTELDNIITLHQRKLDKLQNIKKAYLHEMFI